jgi:hypothetical protein
VLGFLNAIPNGPQRSKSDEDNAIRKFCFEIIMDNGSASPEVTAIQMQFLFK